ncbi:MAG: TlpA family protein disulfide reductase [Halioglobus sp.]|nr:TlpA family protein disulfide reductase [Halioglobus sp.]
MTTDNKAAPRPAYPRTAVLLLCCALLAGGCGEERFAEPMQAPDFTLPTLDGSGQVTLGDYRGDVVYLTFWASWCVPCAQEMPYLNQIWERRREEGLHIIGINVDEDAAAARQFAADHDIGFTLVRDAGRDTSSAYRVPGYPTHYVIDRRGKIRYSGLGFKLDDVGAITQEIGTLLLESVDATD